MPVKLNHTIVNVRDKRASADFLTGLLGLPPARPFAHFLSVDVANELTLDFCDADYDPEPQHYAFLVSEGEFEAIFGRLRASGIDYWADPARRVKGEINRHFGGRGVYFVEPGGHFLEVLTRPYEKSP